ncbi:hypothetical protein [Candidatus Venteria ishoeyi]|uniref:Uncharacterized protein n=1 Tax=Candidatus Venteria ishoeyi TaxID=1899563 RepID=A0A1H6FGD3_9GAMM|nr:hypothetical protein [Candidatus Venteria ishoeyi]SEH09097.1 Uncharacterised protein [Candidatus Venteria ishoeyi]
MSDFDTCLRPAFTEKLLKRLQKGESLNLLSDDPDDVQRLFSEIKSRSSGVCWLRVSLKAYARSFDGFKQDLWRQLPQVQRGQTAPGQWKQLVNLLEQQDKPVWLWLDALHSLFENSQIDKQYNQDFVNSLNSLRNNEHFALLGVTEKPLNQSVFFVQGMDQPASVLELQPEKLPQLSAELIQKEIKRHDVVRYEQTTILQMVSDLQHRQYGFLAYVLSAVENGEFNGMPIEQKLQRWQAEFYQGGVNLRQSMKWRQWVFNWLKESLKWINVLKMLSPVWQFMRGIFSKKDK